MTSELAPTAAPVTAFAAVDPGGRELRDVSVQATRSIEQLGEQLRVLNEGVARLHNIVSRSNPEVETLIRNVVEVQSVLDEFVGFIGSKLENESLRNVEGGR